MLEWLLSHGASIEQDDLGGTPLHDAAEHGQIQVSSKKCELICIINVIGPKTYDI